MEEVWVVIIVNISGCTISNVVGEDGVLFVFSYNLRQGTLKRTLIPI